MFTWIRSRLPSVIAVALTLFLASSFFAQDETREKRRTASQQWSERLTADQLAVDSPVDSEIFRSMASFLQGSSDKTDKYLNDAGFPVEARGRAWSELPPATRLALAATEAFDVSERNGNLFLALLARRINDDYPTIARNPGMPALIQAAKGVDPTTIQFPRNPPAEPRRVPDFAANPIMLLASYVSPTGGASLADIARLTPLSGPEQVEILARGTNTRAILQELFAATAEQVQSAARTRQEAEITLRRQLASWIHFVAETYPAAREEPRLRPWLAMQVPPSGPAFRLQPLPAQPKPPKTDQRFESEIRKSIKGKTDFRPGGMIFKEKFTIPNTEKLRLNGQSMIFKLKSGDEIEFRTKLGEEELRRLVVAVIDWDGLAISQNGSVVITDKGPLYRSATYAHPLLYGTKIIENLAATDSFSGELFYGVRYGTGARYLPQVKGVPNFVDDLINNLNKGGEDLAWIPFLEKHSQFSCNPATVMRATKPIIKEKRVEFREDVLRIEFAPGVVTLGERSSKGFDHVSQETCLEAHRAIHEFNKAPKRFYREVPSLEQTVEIAQITGLVLGNKGDLDTEELKKNIKILGSAPINVYSSGTPTDVIQNAFKDKEITERGKATAMTLATRIIQADHAKKATPRWNNLFTLLDNVTKPILVSRDGALTKDDKLYDGRYHKVHILNVKLQHTYLMKMTSRDFATELILENSKKERIRPELGDIFLGNESVLTYSTPDAGQLRIIATSDAVGDTGSYSIHVYELKAPDR